MGVGFSYSLLSIGSGMLIGLRVDWSMIIGGVLAVHKTGVDLGVIDHGSIVWDEIVPFWLVLLFCPAHWLWQAGAFCLFRIFDIVKPPPARYFDEKVKNGFGVMCDDLMAAGHTLLVLAILRFVLT